MPGRAEGRRPAFPTGFGRPGLRSSVAVALAVLGTALLVATALTRDRSGDVPVFEVLVGGVAASLDEAAWRGDGQLRRLDASGFTTFEGWTVAGAPDVSFDGRSILFAGRSRADGARGIWEMSVHGTRARLLVPCAEGCAQPRYLPDGRLVFAASIGDSAGSVEALFSVRRGGAGLDRITFGRGRDRALAVLPDGRILFERRPPESAPTGAPMFLTVQPDGTGVARAAAPSLPDEGAARRPAGNGDGRSGAAILRVRHLQEAMGDSSLASPGPARIAAVPRVAPPVATSVINAARSTGWLLCLDVWLTSRDGRPHRQSLDGGSVRVIDGESDVVLGEAPLAPDGSFYVEVPANRLLRLQALNATRDIVSTLDSGIWVRPNEQRACLGCHEPRSLAPENRFPQALRGPRALAIGLDAGDARTPIGARP